MENLGPDRPTRRLGFREIVPGCNTAHSEEGTGGGAVPQFDLGRQTMANHRKVVAATRKGPGQPKEVSPLLMELSAKAETSRPRTAGVVGLPSDKITKVEASILAALQRSDPSRDRRLWASDRVRVPAMTEPQRQVIAQIVAGDIERLCRGERVFGS